MMKLFPSLESLESSDELSGDNPSQIPRPAVFQSVEYKIDAIVEKITNVDNLNEDEIKNIIMRQHSMILNYDLFLASDRTRAYALELFTNKKFLKILLDIIGLLELSHHEIICINKLAYDYYVLPDKDNEVSNLLLQISNSINNILVIRLSGILGINGARALAMIGNSSFRVEKNVHRVNTFLVKCNISLSVQNIVDIFCIIFDRFTYTFVYSMLETKQSNFTEDQSKRFDLISLALLAILDSLTSENIKKVLYEYAFTIKLVKQNCKLRFSLKSAKSYTRILQIINEIECDPIDNLIIP